MRAILALFFLALPAQAQDVPAIRILERRTVHFDLTPAAPARAFAPALAYLKGTGWTPETVLPAIRESARILGQCGIALEGAELVYVEAPARYHDFHTATAREFASALALGKPTVYFVAGTRQRPAFEAEAIGRGNSRSRPELADTVWITQGTRDPGIALAHELAHVLMDSGAHLEEPDNLMRAETGPENIKLTQAQCDRMRATGFANGLMR